MMSRDVESIDELYRLLSPRRRAFVFMVVCDIGEKKIERENHKHPGRLPPAFGF